MTLSPVVRFAPSPTGLLHVGNARVALLNRLFAKAGGGTFILRLDDTDLERSKPEYAEAIQDDLRRLGLTWDRLERQSARLEAYAAAAGRLKAMGRLYPCYETPDELDLRRKVQLGRGLPPVYDRAALKLSDDEKAKLEAEGRRPHWRFRLEHDEVRWEDCVRGPSHYHGANLSDPVLVRADGTFLYTLPSVVDDIEMGVTHVIRGEDHVTNTAPQIQLFRALGAEPPAFAHLPLLTGAAGEGLSKRLGSGSLRELWATGIHPMALNSLLAKLGTSDPIEVRHTLAELEAEFDWAKFSRATPKFDEAELDRLDARLMHTASFDEVRARLGIDGADEAFWLAVRGNLNHVSEAAQWWAVCREAIAPVIEDESFTRAAAELLPPEPWDHATWGAWCEAVKQATGRKGKALFHPLRLALTGRENGPELKSLLPLIGRERALARLLGRAA